MRLVLISDTHNFHRQVSLPDGDVLVHAGDFTNQGTEDEVLRFMSWLAWLPFKHKVLVAGNHDFLFERDASYAKSLVPDDVTYLCDSGTAIDGVRFWGSPWQPAFQDWAFNLPRGAALREKWQLIPDGVDVLVTHGPPFGTGDRTLGVVPIGCQDLAQETLEKRPRLHVFGHIHEGYGIYGSRVNASTCNAKYRAANPPVVVDLEPGREPKVVG